MGFQRTIISNSVSKSSRKGKKDSGKMKRKFETEVRCQLKPLPNKSTRNTVLVLIDDESTQSGLVAVEMSS